MGILNLGKLLSQKEGNILIIIVVLNAQIRKEIIMAQTAKVTKTVNVPAYKKSDSTKIPAHKRSTPNTRQAQVKNNLN